MTHDEMVSLREHVIALFAEKERALDMAAKERDRAAEVLRDEQRRAMLVAETEREKSAAALRAGTDRAIADNYERLREQLDAMRRELSAAMAASEKAIIKAEVAADKRFESVNGFREQLAQQSATFLPRETFDSVMHAWATWRENVDRTLSRGDGAETQRRRMADHAQPWMLWAAGLAVTVALLAAGRL